MMSDPAPVPTPIPALAPVLRPELPPPPPPPPFPFPLPPPAPMGSETCGEMGLIGTVCPARIVRVKVEVTVVLALRAVVRVVTNVE